MEQVTLTTPISQFTVSKLVLDWTAQALIIVIRTADTSLWFSYNGIEATTLMRQLNTIDLSVKSLHRRILEKLISDGKLSGTISGVPD